jgi:hypothetical protein
MPVVADFLQRRRREVLKRQCAFKLKDLPNIEQRFKKASRGSEIKFVQVRSHREKMTAPYPKGSLTRSSPAAQRVDKAAELKADFESLRADVARDAGNDRRLTIGQIEAVTRQIASVAKVYDVPDHGSLVRHFAERPKLTQLLLDSADEIVKRFEYDPASIVDDDGELVMRIPTQLSPAVGHIRFSTFLRDWWIPKAGIEDKMTLTIDYV